MPPKKSSDEKLGVEKTTLAGVEFFSDHLSEQISKNAGKLTGSKGIGYLASIPLSFASTTASFVGNTLDAKREGSRNPGLDGLITTGTDWGLQKTVTYLGGAAVGTAFSGIKTTLDAAEMIRPYSDPLAKKLSDYHTTLPSGTKLAPYCETPDNMAELTGLLLAPGIICDTREKVVETAKPYISKTTEVVTPYLYRVGRLLQKADDADPMCQPIFLSDTSIPKLPSPWIQPEKLSTPLPTTLPIDRKRKLKDEPIEEKTLSELPNLPAKRTPLVDTIIFKDTPSLFVQHHGDAPVQLTGSYNHVGVEVKTPLGSANTSVNFSDAALFSAGLSLTLPITPLVAGGALAVGIAYKANEVSNINRAHPYRAAVPMNSQEQELTHQQLLQSLYIPEKIPTPFENDTLKELEHRKNVKEQELRYTQEEALKRTQEREKSITKPLHNMAHLLGKTTGLFKIDTPKTFEKIAREQQSELKQINAQITGLTQEIAQRTTLFKDESAQSSQLPSGDFTCPKK